MHKKAQIPRALRFAFLFSLALWGCAPTPFDPISECPQLAYCGQCASRGGCAWCGDPNQGLCLAVGHAECGAPNTWNKSPETCPAPPTSAHTALSTSISSESAEMKAVGPEQYNALKRSLSLAFPDAHVSNDVVDLAVQFMLRTRNSLDDPGPVRRERSPLEKSVEEKEHPLYLGHADHHRVKSLPPASKAMQSQFMMSVPMVRVPLPEKIDPEHPIIETQIGDVDLARDHLLGSIELIASKYADSQHLGYRPARVDLITPARRAGGRFGAIAVYLGYKAKSDRGPSFYLLEAGTATGDPKMIYYSPSMAPIPSVTSNYLPSPFVTMNNRYGGGVIMQAPPNEDEPDQLIVRSYAPGDNEPYITVNVKYQRAKTMNLPTAIDLTADAAARIALIAKTMGLASAIELQELLTKLGKNLHWIETPRFTETPQESAAPAQLDKASAP